MTETNSNEQSKENTVNVSPGEPPPPPPLLENEVAKAAFERLLPTIKNLPLQLRRPASINVAGAALLAIQGGKFLQTEREKIVKELPAFDINNLDLLQDYALAAWYADQQALIASDENIALADLLPRAWEIRDGLFTLGLALAMRKKIPMAPIDAIRSGEGNVDLANDLMALSEMFRSQREKLQGKIDVEESELVEAERLGAQLLARLQKLHNPTPRADGELSPKELRMRAWSLLWNAYEECQRAAAWCWWKHWHERLPTFRIE